jgi:hypothetical protein
MSIATRLAKLELIVSARPTRRSVVAMRLAFAARLYVDHPEALARLRADPAEPGRVAEYRLDRLLFRLRDVGPLGKGIRLRPIELDTDLRSEPVTVAGLSIPRWDDRWGRVREPEPPTSILLPRDFVGEPLTLPDGTPPADLDAALWLAGRVDGLYVAEGEACVVVAVRAAGGVVATRTFAGVWEEVGTIEEL